MTQYTHLVDRARELEAAQEWAKGVKYIYLADGIVETKFNNGDKLFESDGKERYEKVKPDCIVDLAKVYGVLADCYYYLKKYKLMAEHFE